MRKLIQNLTLDVVAEGIGAIFVIQLFYSLIFGGGLISLLENFGKALYG